ncbi:AGE family epimerase/isomerase [Tautonia sociabilis]|uniref:AGE family epimerase/isomerase n=1 Tax=Tautonia sociabilis TaxID=2080755 RepID=UPI0013153B41|nr:AGE family epimerase/isomerase [Tautonia sociabilis]
MFASKISAQADVFGPVHDAIKVWWTQAEGLNPLSLMHRRFGRETDRDGEAFRHQWSFIESHLIDSESGGWFSPTDREGNLEGDGRKASQWKANYHTARGMMNVVRMLREEGASD